MQQFFLGPPGHFKISSSVLTHQLLHQICVPEGQSCIHFCSSLTLSIISTHGGYEIPKVDWIGPRSTSICISHYTWPSPPHIGAFRAYLMRESFIGTHFSFPPLLPCTGGRGCRAAWWGSRTGTSLRGWTETAVGCTWPRCICRRTCFPESTAV